jgi:hypothetical protein
MFGPLKTAFTPPYFIERYIPRQGNERSCICMLEVSILHISTIFLLDFGGVCSSSDILFTPRVCVERILCCVLVLFVYPMLPISLDSSCLIISSVFSNVYLVG